MPYKAATFRHRRVRAPGRFARGSLRTVPSKGGSRVIVGHLRGERRRTGSGRLVQTVQAVLTPKRKSKRNPWLAVMNPRGKAAPIGVGVREVVYETHATQGRGPWRHVYRGRDVEARGLPSGAVLLKSKSGRPVWERDGRDNWLANPPAKWWTFYLADEDGGGITYYPPVRAASEDAAYKLAFRKFKPPTADDDAGEFYTIRPAEPDELTNPRALTGKSRALVRREFEDDAYYHGRIGAYVGPTPDEIAKLGLSAKGAARIYDAAYVRGRSSPLRNKGGTVARKRSSHRKTKRRPPRGFKSWAAYMASIRPNPKRRTTRRRRRAHSTKGEPMKRHRSRAHRRHNRGRRTHHRRGMFRRNPMTRGIGATLLDGLKGGALVVAGKAVARAIPQFVGVTPVGPLGLGVQTVAGGAAYLLLSRFAGRELARPFLYGVFGNAIESAVRGANVPVLSPSLGDETELHALAGYVPAAVAGRSRAALNGYAPERAALGDESEDAGTPMLVMG